MGRSSGPSTAWPSLPGAEFPGRERQRLALHETNGPHSATRHRSVGLIADYRLRADFASMQAGDTLLLIGESRGELGSSLYLRELLAGKRGAAAVDLAAERRNGDLCAASSNPGSPHRT